MKKCTALLVMLMFSSHAYADKYPDNLKNFLVKDICPMSTYVYIDGLESKVDSKRVDKIVNDLDVLFNTGFSNRSNYPYCTQGFYIIFEAAITSGNNYVYSYSLNIYSSSAITSKSEGKSEVKIARFTTLADLAFLQLESLRNKMDAKFRDSFEQFVLDWRKTH